jgi:hypothetical protein
MKITDILNAIQSGQIRITDHADEEAQNDRLSWLSDISRCSEVASN